MPRIRLSTTRLQTVGLPNLHVGSGLSAGIRAMKEAANDRARTTDSVLRAVDTALVGAARVKGLIDRAADRDADEAAAKWNAAMLGGLEGTVGQDGKPHGGIAQKTWQDYEGTQSSPITDLGEIEKEFQSSEDYKNLSGLAREKFNRRVMSQRAQYLGTVNRIYDRHRLARTQFYDAQADLIGERKIETAILAEKDEDFESIAREETYRKYVRKYRALMENPEEVDMLDAEPGAIVWKDKRAELAFNAAVLGDLRKLALGRCAKLADEAAVGDPKWVGGKLVTNDEQLAKAENYAKKLANTQSGPDGVKRITPEEHERLKYAFAKSRTALDERIGRTVGQAKASALADGNLATLEATKAQLDASIDDLDKKGFVAGATSARVASRELDEAADKRATFEIVDGLSKGRTLVFDSEVDVRKARLYPQVKQAFDAKRLSANNKAAMNAARKRMMASIAGGNPQEFYNAIAKDVVDGVISPQDYTRLKTEFDAGWLKGIKGSGELSRQQQTAQGMLKAMKDKLGADFASAVKTDEFGNVAITGGGGIDYVAGAELPEGRFERTRTEKYRDGLFPFWEREATMTDEVEFSGDETKAILDRALALWSLDGMKITYDPFTGETLPEGKEHTVNALIDFNTLLDGIVADKAVLSAADAFKRQQAYINGLSRQASANEERRNANKD